MPRGNEETIVWEREMKKKEIKKRRVESAKEKDCARMLETKKWEKKKKKEKNENFNLRED